MMAKADIGFGMMVVCCLAVVLTTVPSGVDGHICLLSPHQRGKMSVQDAGDDTCFRHEFPCGINTASPAPYPSYPNPKYFNDMRIDFQQNLNHYTVGFPGYIDISYTTNENPTNESDFIHMYTLSDPNYHMQSKQTNFSVYVPIPDQECDHCIIRIRYVPHKPGEQTFYQCADVSFGAASKDAAVRAPPHMMKTEKGEFALQYFTPPTTATSGSATENQDGKDKPIPDKNHTHLQFLIHDFFNNNAANLFTVDTVSGLLWREDFYPLGIRRRRDAPAVADAKPQATAFFLDQVFAFDNATNASYYMVHETGDWDQIPAMLVRIIAGSIHLRPLAALTNPINGLAVRTTDQLLSFSVVPVDGKPGFYQHSVSTLDPNTGLLHEIIRTTEPDDTYINYQWMELDPTRKFLYVLMGDENSLYQLGTTLFTFNLDAGTYTSVKPNVTKYTFASFHVQASGQIYAVSPGLHKQGHTTPSNSWWLVTMDPRTGAVSPTMEISTPGLFYPHYSGAIFNCPDSTIFYRLDMQDDDGLSVLLTIDLKAKSVHFSSQTILDLAHNLAYVGF